MAADTTHPGQDPYQILGVSPSASQDEIKNAYRNLAKKFHPDLNPGNKNAEKRFKEINSAYELIGSPEAREKARASRRAPFYYETYENQGPGSRYAQGFDADLFENLFRETYDLPITPEASIQGAQTEITLPSGKRLSVRIPPKIAPGTRLRFPRQGEYGDLFVRIEIQASEHFRPDGNDLIADLSVDLIDAILHSEIPVSTPDGRIVLKLPKHVNSGSKIRVAGKGLYEKTGGKRGDLIYVVQLHLPQTISPEFEAAARLEKERGAQRQAS